MSLPPNLAASRPDILLRSPREPFARHFELLDLGTAPDRVLPVAEKFFRLEGERLGLESAVGKIRGRGYKATPQRLAVLRALAEEQHQSLEEIRARCSEVGLVTVYRTLDVLSEIGVVRRLDLGDGPRYELAEDHHHHLICESCGDISEFEECPLDLRRLGLVDFEVSAHSLELYGRCAACR
jgi:Fur family ferric uptake transcriptional regulator